MNVFKYDKVILIKEYSDRLNKVGESFEVANITETSFILRDSVTRVAVGSIDFKDFEKYFKKAEEFKGWTKWCAFIGEGDKTGFYRTNMKKTEVRFNGVKSSAYCSKADEFDLYFGVNLAYYRCLIKSLVKYRKEIAEKIRDYELVLKNINSDIKDIEVNINKMVESLESKDKEN